MSFTNHPRKIETLRKALKDCRAWEWYLLVPVLQQRLALALDLDDGVKANYPKFGKALAKVTGLSKK